MKIRTGIGLDVHPFENGRDFYLGGIKIPYHKGLKGHSDADALIHAIIDALLGAAGLQDIGTYFPDSDIQYLNIRSTELLKKTSHLISLNTFSIGNIDVVICLEKPKIAPYIEQMRSTIASLLQIETTEISIKATTFENMGFVGNEDGILCLATCLLTSP
jgi:2-C-methyl-D-erythritol 2,4-cyclodiphosphate synthase